MLVAATLTINVLNTPSHPLTDLDGPEDSSDWDNNSGSLSSEAGADGELKGRVLWNKCTIVVVVCVKEKIDKDNHDYIVKRKCAARRLPASVRTRRRRLGRGKSPKSRS